MRQRRPVRAYIARFVIYAKCILPLADKDLLNRITELTLAIMDRDLGGKPVGACIAAVDLFVNEVRPLTDAERLPPDLLSRLSKAWTPPVPQESK